MRWAAWVPGLISSKWWAVTLNWNPNKPILSPCFFLSGYVFRPKEMKVGKKSFLVLPWVTTAIAWALPDSYNCRLSMKAGLLTQKDWKSAG